MMTNTNARTERRSSGLSAASMRTSGGPFFPGGAALKRPATPPGESGSPNFFENRRRAWVEWRRLASNTLQNFRKYAAPRIEFIGHELHLASSRRYGTRVRAQRQACRFPTLALLQEPASQERRGIFLDPLIHEREDFLPKIRRVVEPRELVALQGKRGSRAEKVPRRLCFSGFQWPSRASIDEDNRLVINVNSFTEWDACGCLWKTAARDPGAPQRIRACSGCAGDYEDPDRTAGEPEEEEGFGDDSREEEGKQLSKDGLQGGESCGRR